MGVVTYSLFSYGLTAVISFMVIGIIVLIDKVMSKNGKEDE